MQNPLSVRLRRSANSPRIVLRADTVFICAMIVIVIVGGYLASLP